MTDFLFYLKNGEDHIFRDVINIIDNPDCLFIKIAMKDHEFYAGVQKSEILWYQEFGAEDAEIHYKS